MLTGVARAKGAFGVLWWHGACCWGCCVRSGGPARVWTLTFLHAHSHPSCSVCRVAVQGLLWSLIQQLLLLDTAIKT